mmetsp:Transcript_29088/g.93809  ORF Transcript_29088/g.93809 Transcript_29088/m.93809 type:complete len:234 (-) Transcript_29088:706-1407(-)
MVSLATVRCFFSRSRRRHSLRRCQASLKGGRSIFFEARLVGGVDRDVELGHRYKRSNGVGELAVRHEERRDPAPVELAEQLVDLRIHDRFADETQRAVPHRKRRPPPILLDPGNSFCFFDHLHVLLDGLLHDELRAVRLPPPLPPHGILVVPPTVVDDLTVRHEAPFGNKKPVARLEGNRQVVHPPNTDAPDARDADPTQRPRRLKTTSQSRASRFGESRSSLTPVVVVVAPG